MPNKRATRYMKQKQTKLNGEIDSAIITVGDVNIPFSIMDRTTRQKIIKEIEDLNNATSQSELTDIHKTLHSKTVEYTFFSSVYETFSRVDYMLSNKRRLSKF